MDLSDQAISILAFAAYHQLESGEVVSEIVLDDGRGHKASAAGIAELEEAGLLEVNGNRGTFTEKGAAKLATVVKALHA